MILDFVSLFFPSNLQKEQHEDLSLIKETTSATICRK